MAATDKQYAVIEARWTERPSERFVISYSDEESLRDLIAGPNILACGFASLRDAEARIDASLLAAAPGTQPGSALATTRNDRRPTLPRGVWELAFVKLSPGEFFTNFPRQRLPKPLSRSIPKMQFPQ
jgi:hypothetical protein